MTKKPWDEWPVATFKTDDGLLGLLRDIGPIPADLIRPALLNRLLAKQLVYTLPDDIERRDMVHIEPANEHKWNWAKYPKSPRKKYPVKGSNYTGSNFKKR